MKPKPHEEMKVDKKKAPKDRGGTQRKCAKTGT
jgi:energy-converting hydrogenase Eha subunit F